MPSINTFSPLSNAELISSGTSIRYCVRLSISFANLRVRIARSALAGPVPEPVLPIFSFNCPFESTSLCDCSIMPQLLSRYALSSTPKSFISFSNTSGFTTTPGPIITLASLFKKPLGSILTLYVFSPSLIV